MKICCTCSKMVFSVGVPIAVIENEYKFSINIYNQLNLIPKIYERIEIDSRRGIIYKRIYGISCEV